MPIPKPRPNEEKDAFISRCISFVKGEGKDVSQDQSVAMCFGQWRQSKNLSEGEDIDYDDASEIMEKIMQDMEKEK